MKYTLSITTRHRVGYVLLEVILALTVFAFAVLGLANSLNTGIEAAGILNRENSVRIALRSFVEEMRRKPVAEMSAESFDARLQATFVSKAEQMTLKDRNGTVLSDLYVLHAEATYGEGADSRKEVVDVYVYKPELPES